MKLPRRTPNEHSDALAQLHELLYSEDARAQSQGVSMVHVWLNRSSCPHAVESTSSLIQAQLLECLSHPFLDRHQLEWTLRSSYSTALLRFVNSVADAFQTGLYAQSIFNIAQRIGLPAWFVELRHAATHEELPSLPVCRQACRSALQWLDVHFWWPNLARASSSSSQSLSQAVTKGSTEDLSLSLRRYLLSYRKVAKQIAKDESLRDVHQRRIDRLLTKIEHCVRAFGGSAFVDFAQDGSVEEAIDVLLEPGCIVPLAKRKRPASKTDGSVPALPAHLYNTWFPLLRHLDETVAGFTGTFIDVLLSRLTTENASLAGSSYTRCLAAWIVTLFGQEPWHLQGANNLKQARRQRYNHEDEEGDMMEEDETEVKDRAFLIKRCLLSPTPASLVVAHSLQQKDSSQYDDVLQLAQFISTEDRHQQHSEAEDKKAQEESQLLDLIEQMERNAGQVDFKDDEDFLNPVAAPKELNDTNEQDWSSIPGWSLAQDWQPTPLGCLRGAVPDLRLPSAL